MSSCRFHSQGHAVCKCWNGSGGSQEGSWACQLVPSPICLSAGTKLCGRGPLFVFLRQLSPSKSPSAEPMIESDNWRLPYLKAATLY